MMVFIASLLITVLFFTLKISVEQVRLRIALEVLLDSIRTKNGKELLKEIDDLASNEQPSDTKKQKATIYHPSRDPMSELKGRLDDWYRGDR